MRVFLSTIVLCLHQQSSTVNLELSFFPLRSHLRLCLPTRSSCEQHTHLPGTRQWVLTTMAEIEGQRKRGLEKWLSGWSTCRASKDPSSSPLTHWSRGSESPTQMAGRMAGSKAESVLEKLLHPQYLTHLYPKYKFVIQEGIYCWPI